MSAFVINSFEPTPPKARECIFCAMVHINGRAGYQNLTTSAGLPNEEKVAVASVI